jgi:hypothetical protein
MAVPGVECQEDAHRERFDLGRSFRRLRMSNILLKYHMDSILFSKICVFSSRTFNSMCDGSGNCIGLWGSVSIIFEIDREIVKIRTKTFLKLTVNFV